ncbi:MAG: trypsin-like peptidase domain-containing protein [Acidobacteria bacterium]|nr:trypsin-like peptidase domain-containing protein [Acidobacteriota bacterium]
MNIKTAVRITLFLAIVFAFGMGSVLAQTVVPSQQELTPKQTPTPLSLNLTDAFVEGQNLQALPSVSADEVAEADNMARQYFANVSLKPPRVGLVRAVRKITLADAGGGRWLQLPNGGRLWTAAIRSPGAFGLRIHFKQFDVDDDTVLVYARSGDRVIVRGSYTGNGPNHNNEFWTATLPGDTVFIELQSRGQKRPSIEIDSVLHFDKPPYGFTPNDKARESQPTNALSPQELSCHLDPKCQPPGSISLSALDATGQMNFIKGGQGFVCSGTLLKDLDGDTTVPYFLTAYHCLNTQAEGNTLNVVFGYESASCGGTVPNPSTLPFSLGGTLLQTNPTDGGNDMAFIRLNGIQQLPPGAPPIQFAEWSLANGLTNPSYGIHHPGGTFKRITFFEPSSYLLCPTIDSGDDGDYFLANATNGGIEGGSSGSGLFDFTGHLIGQLYGVCGPGISDKGNCFDEDGWRGVYGKFWVSYTIGGVGRWLEIGGTINVNGAYSGEELGTPSKPFRTITAANNLINQSNWNGARIKIQAGCYPEQVTFSRPVTLLASGGTVTIGRCP